MVEITHKELKQLINRCYLTKMPLDIKGAVGIGKSYIAKEVAIEKAKEKGKEFAEWNELSEVQKRELLVPELIRKTFLFVDIRLSQLDPSDLRGLPALNGDYVEWKPNLIWKVLSNPEADGIVFFDEANLAAPSVQSSMYQIINDKQIGELSLSKEVLYLSAGNRTSDRANVFDESAALKNRKANVTLKQPIMDEKSSEDWGKWASEKGLNANIIGFLYFKRSYLHMFDPKSKEPSFPTPRIWEKTDKLIQGVEDMELIRLLMSSTVGEGVAKEFVAWFKLQSKIDFRDLLKHPEKMKKITELDMKYAVVSGVAEMYKAEPKILNEVLGLCMNIEPEFSMFMLRVCKGFSKNNFATQLRTTANWTLIAPEYAKYLL